MTVRPNIRAMKGYTPGEQLNDPDIIKLNTNENPYPPSPRVFEAIQGSLTGNTLRKYPQPLGDSFRNAASRVLGVDPDSILIGNGSDDILTILTRAFVPEGGLIASPSPSYILYRSLAEIQGARFEAVPFTGDWQLDFLEHGRPGANLVVPPEPELAVRHGRRSVRTDRRLRWPRSRMALLVLDEAYADFADWNGLERCSNMSTERHRDADAEQVVRARRHPVRVRQRRSGRRPRTGEGEGFLQLRRAEPHRRDGRDRGSGLLPRRAGEDHRHPRADGGGTREGLGFDVTPSHANFVWCRTPIDR